MVDDVRTITLQRYHRTHGTMGYVYTMRVKEFIQIELWILLNSFKPKIIIVNCCIECSPQMRCALHNFCCDGNAQSTINVTISFKIDFHMLDVTISYSIWIFHIKNCRHEHWHDDRMHRMCRMGATIIADHGTWNKHKESMVPIKSFSWLLFSISMFFPSLSFCRRQIEMDSIRLLFVFASNKDHCSRLLPFCSVFACHWNYTRR